MHLKTFLFNFYQKAKYMKGEERRRNINNQDLNPDLQYLISESYHMNNT